MDAHAHQDIDPLLHHIERDNYEPPPARVDPEFRYVDARQQALFRMQRMATNHARNCWEDRFSDPLAPHALAWLYVQKDPRLWSARVDRWQLTAAWQIWLDEPEARNLPDLLFELHQQFAPRAAAKAGFDIRDVLCVGYDDQMAGGIDSMFFGLGVISLDTEAGTWEQAQKKARNAEDIPSVIRILLADETLIVCQQLGRRRLNEMIIESTRSLQFSETDTMTSKWRQVDAARLRTRPAPPRPDRAADPSWAAWCEQHAAIMKWAIELFDTLDQADNGRMSVLKAMHPRPQRHHR